MISFQYLHTKKPTVIIIIIFLHRLLKYDPKVTCFLSFVLDTFYFNFVFILQFEMLKDIRYYQNISLTELCL